MTGSFTVSDTNNIFLLNMTMTLVYIRHGCVYKMFWEIDVGVYKAKKPHKDDSICAVFISRDLKGKPINGHVV